jgi:hypothetical protein
LVESSVPKLLIKLTEMRLGNSHGGVVIDQQLVNIWLKSKKHREYLLSPRVRKAGVGISKSKENMYVAWAFSDKPLTPPP